MSRSDTNRADTSSSPTPRLLVTAGPSREYFDDVRFLSNASSGRMGIAVADAAARKGWCVDLALGIGAAAVDIDSRVELRRFESAADLSSMCAALWPDIDAFVATAAVCDYRPEQRLRGKKKKEPGNWDAVLVRNPDILQERAQEKGHRVLVGFALEDHPDRAEARRKLAVKDLDVILLNTLQNIGADAGDYLWMTKDGEEQELEGISKWDLGEKIADYVESSWMSSP